MYKTIITCAALFHFAYSNTLNKPQNFCSTIEQIQSFNDAHAVLSNLDNTALVFSDCNETLISSHDYLPATLKMPLSLKILLLFSHPSILWNKDFYEHVSSLVLAKSSKILIEPNSIKILKSIQNQDALFFAITNMYTGTFGIFSDATQWNHDLLKNFNIPLKQTLNNTVFKTLPSFNGNYPELRDGLICCNKVNKKATVINELLKTFSLNPSTIVLFDDSREELEALQELCKQLSINFIGYQFTGSSKIPRREYNALRALKQINHLIETEQWLTDKEL